MKLRQWNWSYLSTL